MLEKINKPQDLKKIPEKKLDQLSQEIRNFILENVSQTGGHLASNLGVVELTIALHRFFDCPKDKLIWDVGHQSYVHKILTGRRSKFKKLRKRGGISGFPKRAESRFDAFGTGHASTSISAAMGIAEAFKKKGQKRHVVAAIGDGALTGGVALEAVNQIGYRQTPVIIILNDNRMSIAQNVGAISQYTKRIEETEVYKNVKEGIKHLRTTCPIQNKDHQQRLLALKKSFKKVGTPGLLFEKLGINYLGPIDGHLIPTILKTLQKAVKIKGPVLIHVRTKKGMGYKHAEKKAEKYHGVSPFSLETGASISESSSPTFSQAFGQKMLELGRKNKKVIAITAAMPDGTGLADFANQLPNQFYDVGITEQNAVTFAAGLATAGFKPVVAIYSSFLQRAYDQIIHDVCLQDLPVIFALDRAGLVGEDGPTHHGVFDLSYLRHIPNLVVAAPKDNQELESMLEFAIKYNHPFALRFPRGSGNPIKLPAWCQKAKSRETPIKLGTSETIYSGQNLTLISVGNQLKKALVFASRQKRKPTLINARFVKPLDPKILSAIKKTGRAVIFEENAKAGGFGSAVLEGLAQKKIKAEVRLVGIEDRFVEHGNTDELRKLHLV